MTSLNTGWYKVNDAYLMTTRVKITIRQTCALLLA
jgi:hypothetical protein